MKQATTYPVHERFLTFQGEGAYAGHAAFFIRTFGCPLHCPWCDSAGTWHKDYRPKTPVPRFTAGELAREVKASGAGICVITGGEPTIHDLGPLVRALKEEGIRAHLETSGAFPNVYRAFDWVTLSPKEAKAPVSDAWGAASEIKLIVESRAVLWSWVGVVRRAYPHAGKIPPIVLHPEWSKREDREVLDAIVEAVTVEPRMFRAGWQMHKLYKADLLDARASKELIPLGGNPALGY